MAQILLIDDDSNLLQMVKLMLERVGHTVTTSMDGERGIKMAGTDKPDLAIIDVMMPGLSGYDVVRKMRDDPATAQIPIIILTARSQPMDKQMALEAGANAFLSKPITSHELTSRVEAVLKAGVNFRVHTGLITEPMRQAAVSAAEAESPAETDPPAPAPGAPITPAMPTRPPGVPSAAPGGQPRPGTPAIRPLSPPQQLRPITPQEPPPGVSRPPTTADLQPLPIGELPVIAVASLRGGSGTTTVAVNLAFLLASRGRRICLTDLSTSSGHIALQLHLPTNSHWGQLLKAGDNPNTQMVTGLLTKHPKFEVSVLAAPPMPSPQTLSTPATSNILKELGGVFQHVVVDVPHLDVATVGALKTANAVIVVMTDDPASVQTTGQFLVALQKLGVEMAQVRLLLNHVRPTSDVPVETIQKALKRQIAAELPYDANQMNAIRRGTPLVIGTPESAFTREMVRLARTLATT